MLINTNPVHIVQSFFFSCTNIVFTVFLFKVFIRVCALITHSVHESLFTVRLSLWAVQSVLCPVKCTGLMLTSTRQLAVSMLSKHALSQKHWPFTTSSCFSLCAAFFLSVPVSVPPCLSPPSAPLSDPLPFFLLLCLFAAASTMFACVTCFTSLLYGLTLILVFHHIHLWFHKFVCFFVKIDLLIVFPEVSSFLMFLYHYVSSFFCFNWFTPRSPKCTDHQCLKYSDHLVIKKIFNCWQRLNINLVRL